MSLPLCLRLLKATQPTFYLENRTKKHSVEGSTDPKCHSVIRTKKIVRQPDEATFSPFNYFIFSHISISLPVSFPPIAAVQVPMPASALPGALQDAAVLLRHLLRLPAPAEDAHRADPGVEEPPRQTREGPERHGRRSLQEL